MSSYPNPIAEFLTGIHGAYRRHRERQMELEDREDKQRISAIGQILADPNLPDETRRLVTGDFGKMLGGKGKEKKKAFESILGMINQGVPGERAAEITVPAAIPAEIPPEQQTRPRFAEMTPQPAIRAGEGVVQNPEADRLPIGPNRSGSVPFEVRTMPGHGVEKTRSPFFGTEEQRIQKEIRPKVALQEALEPIGQRKAAQAAGYKLEQIRAQQDAYLARMDERERAGYEKKLNEYITIYGSEDKAREALQRDFESRISGRQARTESTQATTALTKLRTQFLPQQMKMAQDRLRAYRDNIDSMIMKRSQSPTGQADKGTLSMIRNEMDHVLALYKEAEGNIDAYFKYAETPEEMATRKGAIFDRATQEAKRVAKNLKALLGDKVEVGADDVIFNPDDPNSVAAFDAGQYVYIKPGPGMVGSVQQPSIGPPRSANTQPPGVSMAPGGVADFRGKSYPASWLANGANAAKMTVQQWRDHVTRVLGMVIDESK